MPEMLKGLLAQFLAKADIGEHLKARAVEVVDHAASRARELKDESLAESEERLARVAARELAEADAMLTNQRLELQKFLDRLLRRAVVALAGLIVLGAALGAVLIFIHAHTG
jgi:hypothetical protein